LRLELQEDLQMTDFRTPPVQEPGPQPDPMLQPGRRSSGWIWLFAIAMLAVISATLYGINNQEPQTASNEPAATAAQAPAGETTGAAPKEQQAEQQNGKGNAKQDGGNSQATPANSPNNAAPQKDQSGQTNQQQKPQQ
jgi:hypothetical protein